MVKLKKLALAMTCLFLASCSFGKEKVERTSVLIYEGDQSLREEKVLPVNVEEVVKEMPEGVREVENENWDKVYESKNGLAKIFFRGNSDDLVSAMLVTAFKVKDNEEASRENSLITATFLNNIFEGEEAFSWLLDFVETAPAEGGFEEKIIEGKKIELRWDENKIMYLTVKFKNF